MIIDQLRHQIVKTSTKWELFVTKIIVSNIVKKNSERNIDFLLLQTQKDKLVDQLQCKKKELSTIKSDFAKYKDSTKKEIAQSRAEYKAGKTHTLAEIKKEMAK